MPFKVLMNHILRRHCEERSNPTSHTEFTDCFVLRNDALMEAIALMVMLFLEAMMIGYCYC